MFYQTSSPGLSKIIGSPAIILALCLLPIASAQDRDRNREREPDRDRMTRLDPGTVIPVRTNEAIDPGNEHSHSTALLTIPAMRAALAMMVNVRFLAGNSLKAAPSTT